MKLNNLILTAFIVVNFTAMDSMASLSNHPSSFKETVIRGGKKTIELHISNSISSPLGYSFTIPVNWLKVDPSTGSVVGNSTLTVNLILDASNLAEGNYKTSISLNDPHHGGLSIPIEMNVSTTTGIKDNEDIPKELELLQNYPNPFNPSTTISYRLKVPGYTALKVYDVLGKEIETLVNGYQPGGNYSFNFNASALPSGIYFYRLETTNFIQTRKMLLIK